MADGVYTLRLWDTATSSHISKDAVCDMTNGGYTTFQQSVPSD